MRCTVPLTEFGISADVSDLRRPANKLLQFWLGEYCLVSVGPVLRTSETSCHKTLKSVSKRKPRRFVGLAELGNILQHVILSVD